MAQVVETLIFKADTSQLDTAAVKLRAVASAANDTGDSLGGVAPKANRFGSAIKMAKVGLFAFAAAAGVAAVAINRQLKALEDTGAQLSLLKAQLLTATGSVEAAGQAFDQLNQFALKTPFTLDESIRGFTLLTNLGLNPSEEAMTSFANTSAAMGKSLEQMIEAVADATTNEFERLKEFGIKSKQEGDKVTFTFRGVETEVTKSATAIQDFLVDIGNTQFAGAAIAQTKTLGGSISNLEQAFFNLKKNVGDAGAFETFRQTNEGLASSLGDEKFQEGLGILADSFASIGASLKFMTVDAFKGIVDFLTTTNAEALSETNAEIEELEAKLLRITSETMDRRDENLAARIQGQLTELKQERQRLLDEQKKDEPKTLEDKITDDKAETPKVDEKEEARKAARRQSFADELTELQVHQLRIQEQLKAAHEKEREMFANKYTRELEEQVANGTLTQEQMDTLHTARMEKLDTQHQEEMDKLTEQNNEKLEKRFAFDDASNESLLGGKVDMLGELEKLDKAELKLQDMTGKQKKKLAIGLSGQLLQGVASQSKKGFELHKKVQLAEAIISGHKSIQNSYEKGSKIGGPPVGAAFAAVAAAQTAMQVRAIKSQQLGGGGSVTAPSGGGGVSSADIAETAVAEPIALEDAPVTTSEVNVTIDGAIDPSGTRRIIEAINEATEDGLQINALVGS